MKETDNQPENDKHEFFEIAITGNESPWCIDGRPDMNAEKGPQMMGASLLPVVAHAVFSGETLNKDLVTTDTGKLKAAGFGIGAHRGGHKNPETGKSDCGFADNIEAIFEKIVSQKEEISQRINEVQQHSPAAFSDLGRDLNELLTEVFGKIEAYSVDKLELKGDELIEVMAKEGAFMGELEGDHKEKVAFVNLKKGTTFDVNRANQSGKPAFNLDLWAVAEQAEQLEVDADFAVVAALVFYQATEMVLVEGKGKEKLAVVINP